MSTSRGSSRKRCSNCTRERHRPLDECRDLIEQRIVHDRHASQRSRELLGVVRVCLTSLVEIGQHTSAFAKDSHVCTGVAMRSGFGSVESDDRS